MNKKGILISIVITAIVVGGAVYLVTKQMMTSTTNIYKPLPIINNENAIPATNDKVLANVADGFFVLHGTEQCTGSWEFDRAAAGPPTVANYDLVWRPASGQPQYGSSAMVQTLEQYGRMSASGIVQFKTASYVITLAIDSALTLPNGCKLWLAAE